MTKKEKTQEIERLCTKLNLYKKKVGIMRRAYTDEENAQIFEYAKSICKSLKQTKFILTITR